MIISKNFFKRPPIKTIVSLLIIFLLIKPAYAQLSMTDMILLQIRDTSYSILESVNKIPVYIEVITQMAESWIDTEDTNQVMANNQFMFAKLETNKAATAQTQVSMSQEFTNNYLQIGSKEQTLPPSPNNLNYTILMSQPLPNTEAPKDQDAMNAAAKKFIQNLGGLEVKLEQPDLTLRPSAALMSYQSFYNTMASIKSYNAYILAGLYNQQESEEINNNLRTQATSSDWFQQIATESLGLVLRQILMYDSQIYVQLNQLVKLQQQAISEQALTNTLVGLAAQHLMGEDLLRKAQQAARTGAG